MHKFHMRLEFILANAYIILRAYDLIWPWVWVSNFGFDRALTTWYVLGGEIVLFCSKVRGLQKAKLTWREKMKQKKVAHWLPNITTRYPKVYTNWEAVRNLKTIKLFLCMIKACYLELGDFPIFNLNLNLLIAMFIIHSW